MTHNRPGMEMLLHNGARPPEGATRPSRLARLAARLLAARMDSAIDRGAPIGSGSVMAAHGEKITSFDEREQLARSLRAVHEQALGHRIGLSSRVPVDRDAVLANSLLFDEVRLRLHAPLPVRARGMARLRILLSDGSGPLYRPPRGSLAAQLRGVLAAL